ncbi:uncharacterized protein [Asterias amurensis]|uniref:uncharacterized protein isoform X2 n=1 Tax=Asterias amurensis TaxID=7602 RepID=UPI003AB24E32
MARVFLLWLVVAYAASVTVNAASGNPVSANDVLTPLSIVGKPTEQSTTYLAQYSSDKAVDGSQDTRLYPNGVCSHTHEEANPWWRVDLGAEHCIAKVTILNRGDCCSNRLTNAVVRMGLNNDVLTNEQCGSAVTAAQASPLGGTIEFNCESPMRAQYISVNIPSGGILQLCEVTVEELPLEVCSPPVAAPLPIVGMPTEQSTTYLAQYSSDKAVDGSQDTRLYPNGVCSHTHEEANPWWRVDLGAEHCIAKVTILNRGDCCSNRLTNAVVRVGLNSDVLTNDQCGSAVTAAQASPLGGTIEFNCESPMRAQYISVNIPSGGTLQLCEVTVEELPLEECPPALDIGRAELDIVGKPTEQSSDFNGKLTSDKAVDGSQDSLLNTNFKCSHTGKENAPWWRVDLEDAYTISKVTILNRGDCCNGRLTGAAVRAGMCGGEVTNNQQCGSSVTSEQAAVPGATIEFVCDPPLRARYVSVDLQSEEGEYLQLCEVTVEQVL